MSERQTKWGGSDVGAEDFSPLPVSVSLRRAMLCVDCDRIFNLPPDGRCPLCGSSAIIPVDRWLPGVPATAPAAVA